MRKINWIVIAVLGMAIGTGNSFAEEPKRAKLKVMEEMARLDAVLSDDCSGVTDAALKTECEARLAEAQKVTEDWDTIKKHLEKFGNTDSEEVAKACPELIAKAKAKKERKGEFCMPTQVKSGLAKVVKDSKTKVNKCECTKPGFIPERFGHVVICLTYGSADPALIKAQLYLALGDMLKDPNSVVNKAIADAIKKAQADLTVTVIPPGNDGVKALKLQMEEFSQKYQTLFDSIELLKRKDLEHDERFGRIETRVGALESKVDTMPTYPTVPAPTAPAPAPVAPAPAMVAPTPAPPPAAPAPTPSPSTLKKDIEDKGQKSERQIFGAISGEFIVRKGLSQDSPLGLGGAACGYFIWALHPEWRTFARGCLGGMRINFGIDQVPDSVLYLEIGAGIAWRVIPWLELALSGGFDYLTYGREKEVQTVEGKRPVSTLSWMGGARADVLFYLTKNFALGAFFAGGGGRTAAWSPNRQVLFPASEGLIKGGAQLKFVF